MDVTAQPIPSNFAFLKEHDEQLVCFGMLAERYFPGDPNTRLLKLRQLTELFAELVAARTGLYVSSEESQFDLIRQLQDRGLLPREVAQLFGEVRRADNVAVHEGTGDHRTFKVQVLQVGAFHSTGRAGRPAWRNLRRPLKSVLSKSLQLI